MKKIILLFFCIFSHYLSYSQDWKIDQISTANTAKDIEYLTIVEKDAIKYINLCRLYPKDFIKNELEKYFGTPKYGDYVKHSKFRKSLISHLNSMTPVPALNFDVDSYNNAKCFAKEQGEAGTTGHQRINCTKGNYAECVSYGMDTGMDIAMQWLIDHKIEGVGHRLQCLKSEYTKVGLSVNFHKIWGTCAVVNMIW